MVREKAKECCFGKYKKQFLIQGLELLNLIPVAAIFRYYKVDTD